MPSFPAIPSAQQQTNSVKTHAQKAKILAKLLAVLLTTPPASPNVIQLLRLAHSRAPPPTPHASPNVLRPRKRAILTVLPSRTPVKINAPLLRTHATVNAIRRLRSAQSLIPPRHYIIRMTYKN
jgi:hypothetical protein